MAELVEKLVFGAGLQPGVFLSPLLNIFVSVAIIGAGLLGALFPVALAILTIIGVIALVASAFELLENAVLFPPASSAHDGYNAAPCGRNSTAQGIFDRMGDYGNIIVIGIG